MANEHDPQRPCFQGDSSKNKAKLFSEFRVNIHGSANGTLRLSSIRVRSASETGSLSGEISMRTLYRVLCIVTVSTFMSGSALVAQAQQDGQPNNNQAPAYDQQNSPPADQAPANQQDPRYNQPDQQYNQDGQQAAPPDNQAEPRDDQEYDQSRNGQVYDQNPQYNQNETYDQNDGQAPQQPDRVAPDPRSEQGPRPEDQPLETPQTEGPQYDSRNNTGNNTPDPPGRAARLQYMTGSISVQPQGTGDWVTGEINRPLTNGDNIWADKNSRAEISVGTAVIRIGSESSLTITNITENSVQLQLHQGALNLHVRRLQDGEKYEVDTPNQAFNAMQPGDYRFDVDSDGDKTIITIWRGEGESTGDGPAVRVHTNEQVRFSNGTSMTVDSHAAPAPDAFDEWAQSRDQRLDHSESARYVAPNVVGSDDLDEYGAWRNTPDYGEVWTPAVGPGWAPYSDGHWIWQYPWGWTWVDYEPWGYAPFHYGRWVYAGGFWGWAPGPIYARPYYAPALVAWFGGGWGVGVGFGFGGGFGWCPLGWGEPFIPWYGVSRGYFGRVNFGYRGYGGLNGIYTRNFNHGRLIAGGGSQLHYANMHAPGGFTAVSRDTLVNSRSVAHNNLRVSPSALNRMSAVHSPGVAPTRASMAGSRASAAPPQRAFSRPVVSHSASYAGNRGQFNGSRTMNSRASAPMTSRNSVPHPPGASISRSGNGYSRSSNSYGRGSYGGAYGRSAPANGRGPAYGGRASGPSYGGRAPGYGGAYGRSAPAYGGRAPSSGGGRAAPSGGGGHAPSGGGGHSSGGGGGGGHSSGGHH